MDSADLSRVRQIEEDNGYAVYTRNRRLRTRGERGILEKLEGYSIDFGVNGGEVKMAEVRSEGARRFTRSVLKLNDESSEMENGDRRNLEGNLSNLGFNGGEGKAVEVKEDSAVGVRSEGARRFTRSVLKLHDESSEMENEDSRRFEGSLTNLGVNDGEGKAVEVKEDSTVGVRSEGARRFTRSVLKLHDESSEMEGNLSNLGVKGGEEKMVDVKKDSMVGVRSEGPRRFTRSVLKLNDESSEMENGDCRSLEGNLSNLGVNAEEEKMVDVKKDSMLGGRSEGARRFTRSVLKLNDESSEMEKGDCRSLEANLSNLVVNGMEDKKVEVRSKRARRFTRSVLKVNDESSEMGNGDSRGLEGDSVGVRGEEVKMVEMKEDKKVEVRSEGGRRFTRSVLKLNDESSELGNVDCRGLEGNSVGLCGGEVKMVEMKEGSTVGVRSEGGRRFTRSVLKLNNSSLEMENGDSRALEGNSIELSNLGFKGGEGKMMEVKEDSMVGVRSEGVQRFTRSVLKFTNESSEMENGDCRDLRDAVVPKSDKSMVLDTPKRSKMEMKMSRKILIQDRPATPGGLLKTGLLEGYPVFYNGGKRGALRGTVKDYGILCSCSLCKGAKVVRPARFEFHASKSYTCTSAQYICFENGKSLLDLVKECRRSPLKTLEEIIQKVAGPLPVKNSVNCRNCGGSFLATPVAQVDLLCDSCMIIVNSEVDAKCDKFRSLEPFSGITMSDNSEMQNTSQIKSRPGGKKRKHSESSLRSSERSSSQPSSRRKGKLKITNMLSNAASLPESSGSGSPSASGQSKSSTRITKKDLKMHRLVFENGGLPDGTELGYYSHGKKLRDGYKMGSGIICRCCNSLVSASQFEAHAGWASRRKPYMYIYTSNGVSLHEYAVSLLKGSKYSSRENDDLCSICADGGELVLCDGCPRAFHIDCASLSSIPDGKWFCTYCLNMFQRDTQVEWNDNAVAAGRVSGIDPLQQITDRCMRIVKTPEEAEVIACVLCRGFDFSKSGFGPLTVLLCDQCEKEYHVGCLKEFKMAELKKLPKGKWFCSVNCQQVFSALQNLLTAGAEKLPDSSLDVIKKKNIEKSLFADTDFDVKWRLLSGKIISRETRVLLSQAVAIFHDSFAPIVDCETGLDLIPSMVYGRNTRDQDFSGMYCAILTVNSTIVSAAILRVFGQEIAELPLAATRSGNQGKGYFQVLYSCIEKLLAFLNVKRFVLPATDAATSIWTDKFGFERIPQEQLLDYRKNYWQMMTFKGTSILEKPVPKCRITNHHGDDSNVPSQ